MYSSGKENSRFTKSGVKKGTRLETFAQLLQNLLKQ